MDDSFSTGDLNEELWFPYYLPHWSSRRESAATYRTTGECLELAIPIDQPLWCPQLHEEPLRVSCIQSGNIPGSQPFREDLRVNEPDTEFRGHLPLYGDIGIRMRGDVTTRSMFAFWLSGIEEEPGQSGEICVAEIFGSGMDEGRAEVGVGMHAFRDPALVEEFSELSLAVDVSRFHDYEVSWRPGSLTFSVDGRVVRRIAQAPDYPVQLMIGVFDFPNRPGDPAHEPTMWVERVWSHPLD